MGACDVYYIGNGPLYDNNLYGSLNPFYSIANSAIDNLQSSISNSKKWELYCAMNMNPGCGNDNLIDATSNQFGIYFLTGTGSVIFIVMVLIAIFFTCCLRCCRNRCCKKNNMLQYQHSKVESFVSLAIQLFVYFLCFGFIMAGTIIFGQSVANFRRSINTYSIQHAQDLRESCTQISTQGDGNLMCTYNQTIQSRLSNLPDLADQETQRLIDIWWSQSGLLGLNPNSQQNLTTNFQGDYTEGIDSLQKLNAMKTDPIFANPSAQNELQSTIDAVTACQTALKNLINYMPQVIIASNNCLSDSTATQTTLQNSFDNQNALLVGRLYKAEDKVYNVTRSVINVGYESARWSYQLWTTISIKMQNANLWGGLDAITSTADLVVILPACLMMFFMLIAILICIFKMIGLILGANRGKEHGRIVANILRVATYVLMWLAVAPIMAAIALVWYGQLYAGTCYNLYDPMQRLNFYRNLEEEYLRPVNYNQNSLRINYGSFLSNLLLSATLWSSLEQQSILMSSSDFVNDINPQLTLQNINSIISSTNLNANLDQAVFNNYHTLFLAYNSSVNALDALRGTDGFLPYCSGLNWNASMDAVGALFTYSVDLDAHLRISTNLDGQLDVASSDQQIVTRSFMMDDASGFYAYTFQNNLNVAISNFLNQVRGSVYLTNPIYYNYVNSGNMLCNRIRSPVNGTWAAAGMIGLFWIPAVICLFFTSSYLYKVHKRKPLPIVEEPVQPQPVVIPQATVLTPVVATAPVIAVDTPVIVEGTVVTSTASAPAIYPVIAGDSMAIIEGL